jgi:hypothetical protein
MGFEKVSQPRTHSTRRSAKTMQINAKSAVQQAHSNTTFVQSAHRQHALANTEA